MRTLLGHGLVCLLVVAAGAAQAEDPPAGETGAVAVRVVDPAGTLVGTSTVTVGESFPERARKPDDDGIYRIAGLAPGRHSIGVTTPGFRPAWTTAAIAKGATTDVTVTLDPGVAVEGIVVDAQGRPVAGVEVGVTTIGGEDPSPGGWVAVPIFPPSAQTDAQGRFRVTGLAPREATIEATRGVRGDADRLRLAVPVRATPPVKDLRLVVGPSTSAVIRLRTPDGRPFVSSNGDGVSTSVWWRGDYRTLDSNTRSAGAGVFVFDDLQVGAYEFEIDTRAHVPVQGRFVAVAHTRLDLGTVVLDPGLPLRGRVTDTEGHPLADARVLVTAAPRGKPPADHWLASQGLTGGTAGNFTTTDEDGSFVLEHAPAGRVFVEAATRGYAAAPLELEVALDTAPLAIALGPGAAVWCTLRHADGTPGADERLMAVRWGTPDGPSPAPRRELRATSDEGVAGFRLTTGRWRIVLRTFPKGGAPGTLLLAEQSFVAGKTYRLTLTRPE